MTEQQTGEARGVDDLPAWVRRSWLVPLVIGLALVVMGVVLLVDLRAGIDTLRWLVVFSLLISGVEAFATASLRSRPWVGWVAGLVFLIGAIVGIAWPAITLLALVLTVGVSLLIGGMVRVAMSWSARTSARGWGWSFAGGLLAVVAGLIFLLGSPVISLVALAVVLGVYVLTTGVSMVTLAFAVRRLVRAVPSR
ncbi:MAG: DUF308 domain-containing protein [Allobranchiibius sp.]